MKRPGMPVRSAPLSRGSGFRPCGTPYETEEAARESARGQRDGASFARCWLSSCRQWHVSFPPAPAATGAPRRPVLLGSMRRRDTGPSEETRKKVYKRDGYACVCCGTPIDGRPHSVGHRKRRAQGGGNLPSNLLTFLGLGINPLDPGDHHARIDSRRDPEDEAKGFTVRSWQDPALVPVMVFSEHGSGATAWPLDDGTWSAEAPEGAEAA